MFLSLLFIFGCSLGSFYCLAAERMPIGGSLLKPASHCPYCCQKLRFYELVPILSVLAQRFRCRHCEYKIPFIYFTSELVGGIICLFCFSKGINSDSLQFFLLLSMGLLLTITDYFYLLVEPRILYFFTFLLTGYSFRVNLPILLHNSLSVFIVLSVLLHLFKQTLGGGDILLLTSWSLFLELSAILFILFSASSFGLIYAGLHYWQDKQRMTKIPFVPFLFMGLFLHLLIRSYF